MPCMGSQSQQTKLHTICSSRSNITKHCPTQKKIFRRQPSSTKRCKSFILHPADITAQGIFKPHRNRTPTLNSLSNGLYSTKASSPLWLRHRALNTLGRAASTSRVVGTSLTSRELRTTSVRPLSCSDESSDGSWNTNTVTTSNAVIKTQ